MNEREKIGQRLAEIREEKGLTIRTLADMAGINYANISKIEHGRYNVSIDILSKVAKALNCTIEIKRNDN